MLTSFWDVLALPLLKSSKHPKFIPIISFAGPSLTAVISMPVEVTCYGMTKAAFNYMARRMHFENEWIGSTFCFPLSPGVTVDTDMFKCSLFVFPVQQQMMSLSPERCATLLVNIIEESTREKDGGEFINIDGTKIPW
ncbi:hypothetical protein GGU10DRAFT_274275 [Lentinula aff. detonsa]|uniref:Uncharacterized protein n=1 Tax=Lentinula aff. detonsa TaxID=2804958 RepID=A0AA38KQD1_9AGAR|nr:hypothetical protein GGU10DRAFT_274275 [Lentinula aff. detonsa]